MVKRQKLVGEPHGKEFELIDENTALKSEVKKLKQAVKSLNSKQKYTESRGGAENRTQNLGYDQSRQLEQTVSKMKDRLKENIQTIQDLRVENQLLQKGDSTAMADERTTRELRRLQSEVSRLDASLSETNANFDA